MKKFLVFALVAMVALVSCKKDNPGGDDEKAFKQTARMKTLIAVYSDGEESWEYTYNAQGRVSQVVAAWAGEPYSTFTFTYSGNTCVVKDGDKNAYDIDLNDKGLATKIKDYVENKTIDLFYDADGFITSALINGEDACQQSVTNECVDYWTRKGDGDTWRHKEHTYTTTENVGAVHTEWAEDCGIKRWIYESGLVGRASRYCCATAQWADRTALAEYEYQFDATTGAISKETKNYGEPGALEFDCEFKFTWEAIK